MAVVSAGVLLYRRLQDVLEVLLVHPGGPYWRSRDAGAWQLPKGEIEPDEAPEDAARRAVQHPVRNEWPPRSGRRARFPEIDAKRWMTLSKAEAMILPSQRPLLTRLAKLI